MPDSIITADASWVVEDSLHTATQRQQAVARAIEECAAICEGMHEEDRPGDYAAAIRAKGTHD